MFLLAEELSSVIRPVMVIRKLWVEKVTQRGDRAKAWNENGVIAIH